MTTATTLAPTDPRSFFANAVALGGATIGAVSPAQLIEPTPCDSFDVRTLIGHLVAVLQRVANVGNGGTVYDTPEVVEGVADDGWLAAWNNAAHDVQRVCPTTPSWARRSPSRGLSFPAPVFSLCTRTK